MTDGRTAGTEDEEGWSEGGTDNDGGSGDDDSDGGVGLVRSDGALAAHVRN